MSGLVWQWVRLACVVMLLAAGVRGQDAPALKAMAVDAEPSFEVATIKPNDSHIGTLLGIKMAGRSFTTTNSSLVDLIGFAYGVQGRQVFEAPKWATEDRYDVSGVPDVDGIPNVLQQRTMLRKLLADRFKLTFHEDKRELPAFVITESKRGAKLVPTTMTGLLPVTGVRPTGTGWQLNLQNASMAVLTNFLQLAVMDRPVVEHTGLTGRYDFKIDFTPDSTQFHGMIPARQVENPAPGLTEALDQGYGLKMTSEKALVGVVVVDGAEKPAAN